jgi:hypothetical protein
MMMAGRETAESLESRPPPSKARAVRAELACAKTLLDELETVLEAHDEERTRCDVVAQLADQLDRLANTMREWTAGRVRADPGSGVVMSRPSRRLADPARGEP